MEGLPVFDDLPGRHEKLKAAFEKLDPKLRVPTQAIGRRYTIGCVAVEITQRCNLDCTLCYLSESSEKMKDIPLEVKTEEGLKIWNPLTGQILPVLPREAPAARVPLAALPESSVPSLPVFAGWKVAGTTHSAAGSTSRSSNRAHNARGVGGLLMRRPPIAAASFFLFVAAYASAQKPDCSIRPPRGTSQEELSRMAKVTSKDAETRAIASVAPDKVTSIMSSGVEVVNGCLAWPFDLRFASKGGVTEVMVDAGDGRILSSEYEPPAGGAAPQTPAPAVPATPEGTPPAALPPGVVPVTDAVAAAEEALIRKAVDTEEDAWNRTDAKAFAARFQEEGSLTDVLGAVSRGRAEIERRQSELFTAYFKGSLLALKVRKIRFLKPDVAIVEIDTEVSGFHKAPPAVFVDAEKVIRTRLLQVMVKSGSDWTIASFHGVDVKTPPETLVNPEDPARARRRR